jgi:DNA-directed RNA polymerase sigma subunit (sigma70/sigma32)
MTAIALPEAPTEDQIEWIETQTWITFRKVCKPTAYEVDDFIGEGYLAWTKARDSFDPSKGATFNTWFNFILWRHLYDIVYDSYKKIGLIGMEDMSLFHEQSEKVESEVNFQDWTDAKFSHLEKQYVAQCLHEKSVDPKGFRDRVREKLNLTERVEDVLRASIRKIILAY